MHLASRDAAGFEAALAARYTVGSPLSHKWISSDEIAAFAPTAADRNIVADALAGYGIAVLGSNAAGTSLTVSGSAGAMQRAFNTRLHTMMQDGSRVVAEVTPVQAQGALFGRVKAVTGLAGLRAKPMLAHAVDADGKAVAGVALPAAGADATSVLASFSNRCFGTDGSALLSDRTTSAAYEGVTYAFNGKVCAYTPKQIADITA